MVFEVWHMIKPQFELSFGGSPLLHHFKVAEVQALDPEEAYRLTNNIDTYWTENPEVTVCAAGESFRSTMVGDFVRPKGTDEYIVVMSCGFESCEVQGNIKLLIPKQN